MPQGRHSYADLLDSPREIPMGTIQGRAVVVSTLHAGIVVSGMAAAGTPTYQAPNDLLNALSVWRPRLK
jgi:hypothetical protein